MRRRRPQFVIFALLVMIALAALREYQSNVDQPAYSDARYVSGTTATFVRAIDGDTLDARVGEFVERVRLLRIDTPERDEPGYDDARRSLERSARSGDGSLTLTSENQHLERDQYGRLLAYVFLSDKRNLNIELVKRGWSTYYTKYGYGQYRTEFERAEADARESKSGLWKSGSSLITTR